MKEWTIISVCVCVGVRLTRIVVALLVFLILIVAMYSLVYTPCYYQHHYQYQRVVRSVLGHCNGLGYDAEPNGGYANYMLGYKWWWKCTQDNQAFRELSIFTAIASWLSPSPTSVRIDPFDTHRRGGLIVTI